MVSSSPFLGFSPFSFATVAPEFETSKSLTICTSSSLEAAELGAMLISYTMYKENQSFFH